MPDQWETRGMKAQGHLELGFTKDETPARRVTKTKVRTPCMMVDELTGSLMSCVDPGDGGFLDLLVQSRGRCREDVQLVVRVSNTVA